MSIRKVAFGVLVILGLVPATSFHAWADALDDIMRSPILSDRRQHNANSDTIRWDDERWFVGRPNLRKLFVETEDDKGPMYLLQWFGELATVDYTLKSKKAETFTTHVSLNMTYAIPQNGTVTVEILVPHPLQRDQVDLKLLPEFARLEPPSFPTDSLEKMQIRNLDAVFYQHKDGNCSLLFKIAAGTHLNLITERCSDSQHLITIAEQSDLMRLNHKLDS